MRKLINRLMLLALVLTGACIEPITFDTGSEPRRLVVEGLISNISYNDRLTRPNPAERFYVRLQWTGPVNNERNDIVAGATVFLLDDQGSSWPYFWSTESGAYIMSDDSFAADPERTYHVQVIMPDGEIYESDKEKMHVSPDIPGVEYTLESRIREIDIQGQTEFVDQEGLALSAILPEHGENETYYYRWKVTPSWVYVAPLTQPSSPVRTCYVTNKFYFQKIYTRLDQSGGYPFELFFLQTVDNERLFFDFTAYVTQYSLSPEAWEFWDQLGKQQESGGGIFDPPPFDLVSNMRNVNNPEEKVSGFFSVAHESSVRWFINGDDLPYDVFTGIDPCIPPPGVPNIPTPDCLDCRQYKGGSTYITTERPVWWREY